jgi:RNA polymerase sigma-70 factor (ECF subfamily)
MTRSANDGRELGSPGPEATSTSLLDQVKRVDPDAWGRLVRLYSPLIYAWCRHCGLSGEDAGDVVQEVFRAVHSAVGKFRRERTGDTFRGWLWTITRNKIRDDFRARMREPRATGGTDAQARLMQLPEREPAECGDSTEAGSSSSLFRWGLECVRAEFEQRTWEAFWRTAINNEATANVAQDLKISTGAVRKAKFRVLHRLREEFGELTG